MCFAPHSIQHGRQESPIRRLKRPEYQTPRRRDATVEFELVTRSTGADVLSMGSKHFTMGIGSQSQVLFEAVPNPSLQSAMSRMAAGRRYSEAADERR